MTNAATEIEKAEAVVKSLEDTRRHLTVKATELAEERQRISYAAHAGNDKKARQRLDEINAATASHASEMASVEAAITEANSRLDTARRSEALAADREQAKQLRETLARFTELGLILDDAFQDITSAATEMKDLLSRIHGLGAASPTHDQFRVLGLIACKTAMMQVPFMLGGREWEFLPPNQRKSFASIVAGWQAMVERNIAARLGKQEEAA